MASEGHCNLVPPVVESGKFIDLVKAGQTVSASHSPLNTSLAIFIANSVSTTPCNYYIFLFPFVLGAATGGSGRY